MLQPKRIHQFNPLTSSEIDEGTVFEVEKLVGETSVLLLETGDALLLESGDHLLLEESVTTKWINYKITYAELLARIISDLP